VSALRSRANRARQDLFVYPVLSNLLSVDLEDRYLETIPALELGIAADVDFTQVDWLPGCDFLDDALHLFAEVTARPRIDRQGHGRDRAIVSAATRGSGAAMIGRPTTM
jgi:hypothetical protein